MIGFLADEKEKYVETIDLKLEFRYVKLILNKVKTASTN